jgi:hypothetical protein
MRILLIGLLLMWAASTAGMVWTFRREARLRR